MFSGWSGDYSGSSNPLVFTMDGNKAVTATFVAYPRVRIEGSSTPYYLLGPTLGVPGGAASIRAQAAALFTENIIMKNPVTIQLKGGYSDVDFSSQSGDTTIGGSLRIKAGTLKVNHLKILPCDGSGICTLPPAICGDGHVDASEQCDDANLNSGDGCSASCSIESAYSMHRSTERLFPSPDGLIRKSRYRFVNGLYRQCGHQGNKF